MISSITLVQHHALSLVLQRSNWKADLACRTVNPMGQQLERCQLTCVASVKLQSWQVQLNHVVNVN